MSSILRTDVVVCAGSEDERCPKPRCVVKQGPAQVPTDIRCWKHSSQASHSHLSEPVFEVWTTASQSLLSRRALALAYANACFEELCCVAFQESLPGRTCVTTQTVVLAPLRERKAFAQLNRMLEICGPLSHLAKAL